MVEIGQKIFQAVILCLKFIWKSVMIWQFWSVSSWMCRSYLSLITQTSSSTRFSFCSLSIFIYISSSLFLIASSWENSSIPWLETIFFLILMYDEKGVLLMTKVQNFEQHLESCSTLRTQGSMVHGSKLFLKLLVYLAGLNGLPVCLFV